MRLLIDGYNLLHASGVFPPAASEPSLERSRQALLDALADVLTEKVVSRTMVVFDAVTAPPGLPSGFSHRGIAVQFARRGGTADELLEELIAAEPDPRNLTVVSSDHRVQRAARQRRASFTDSDVWWSEAQRLASAKNSGPEAEEKPIPSLDNPFPPGYGSDVLGE
jgi:uncharacterized protein